MLLKIFKNRTVSSSGTWGTKNENNYEILNFEFPEELEEYNKRIVYYLGNQKVWDAIIDNKAILTNAITTKGSVKAYIWCTKSDEAFETDVDFRTQIFVMNFFENENADGIVPTPEQVDGFNTMLTAMNEKIEEINELETTIENAETQRQENEETRQENESTRQENEQTRQEQEAERERRTDEAIGNIEDKTAEYNANAEAKTTAFNNNATQKTNDFNSNYTQKVNDFNTNASSKELAFNSNAESKTSTFNTNATNKTNDFNSNASSKATAFNNNATSKTNDFNTNAENKTSAFNDNATQKTTNFDNNASSKTTTFNENATSKTNDFNDNATQKTTAFNNNAQAKTEAFDEHTAEITADIEDLQQEVEELSENMPWNTTEQATEITVDDAAKYSKNKLELFGNTSQDSTTGKNLWGGKTFTTSQYSVDFTINVDGTITASGTASSNSVSGTIAQYNNNQMYKTLSAGTYTVSKNSDKIQLQVYDTSSNIIKTLTTAQNTGSFTLENSTDIIVRIMVPSGTTVDETFSVQLEQGSTSTDYEPYTGGVPSPNPDYPQDIHVVTGENNIEVRGRNLIPTQKNMWESGHYDTNGKKSSYATRMRLINLLKVKPNTTYRVSYTSLIIRTFGANQTFLRDIGIKTPGSTFTTDADCYYLAISADIVYADYNETSNKLALFLNTETDRTWEPYYHQDYPLNLGSLELCKIGDYQDYFYKENGNWYIEKLIDKDILTDTDNWNIDTSSANYIVYKRTKATLLANLTDGYCNYFIVTTKASGITNIGNVIRCGPGAGNMYYVVVQLSDYPNLNTLNNWLSWLENHNIVFYGVLRTPTTTQITDETLIAQLDAIYEHLQLVKGTNNITVTAEDLAPYMELTYMQDLKSKLDNLDSRLSLLE